MASNVGRVAVRLFLVVPLFGMWLMAHSETTHAHGCVEIGSPAEELEEADAVFLGRVVAVTRVERDGHVELLTEFDVATVWKGPADRTLRISTNPNPLSYGYHAFTKGEVYIVYANYSEEREGLRTGLCARTTELSWGLEDLAKLGEGVRPGVEGSVPTSESSGSGGGCSASPGAVEVSFVGALVGLMCLGVRKRRGVAG